jgi:hypothetical protein
MMDILLAISFIAVTASTTARPLSWASLADLRAILSVCCALSAFCLIAETISSIEADASSAEAACVVAPLDSSTDAVLIDMLAELTSLAMVRISVTVRVRSLTMVASARISLSSGDRSWMLTVRLPREISSAARVISFMASTRVFRLFLMRLKSPR